MPISTRNQKELRNAMSSGPFELRLGEHRSSGPGCFRVPNGNFVVTWAPALSFHCARASRKQSLVITNNAQTLLPSSPDQSTGKLACMTKELYYLLYVAILTGVLWVPVVIGYVVSRGPLQPEDYVVAPTAPLKTWVHRANRAHLNAVENFAQFAAVVLIAHAANVSTAITVAAAAVYFYARLVHAVLHISGFSHFRARTAVFTIGWIAFMTFAVELLRKVA